MMPPHSFQSRALVKLRLSAFAAAACAITLVAACNKAADAPAKPAAVATPKGIPLPDGSIPSALVTALDSITMSKMEIRTGVWKEADASSTWSAYANDGSVRVIDERVTAGENSTRRVMNYYTSDGRLSSHIETRNQLVMAGDRAPSRQFVLMSLEFVGDSVVKQTKSVNGEAKPIEKFEIADVKKHGDVLLSAALTAPVATAAKP